MNAAAGGLTVTLDIEDHRHGDDPQRRYRANTERLLDFLDARGVRATLFIVGDIVDDCAALIRRAADAGHELALHSATHTPLTEQDPAQLGPAIRDARARLADLAGQPVTGFRAPVFSLTPATTWAPALLTDLGFTYSSSILPAANPLFGYPGAPMTPFRWPSGLIELPVPLGRLGPAAVPFLGGIYLRYLPLALVRRMEARLAPEVVRWSYLHPYDIDADEGYYRFPGTTWLQSVALWRRRGGTPGRIARLLDGVPEGVAAPLGARVAGFDAGVVSVFSGGGGPRPL